MNVAEIRDRLDDYGDHVDVALELADGRLKRIIAVDDTTRPDGTYVTITAEGL